ncbi:amidohydrolase family protein [Subtercola boreus]|uniref:Amidohydrolase n=1 Tax=Subtercola boreus TaxID=120213 RepID=A0A3E0WFX4_9MICO|nr:amidohydrolase family protein [Subtercola boreus]RFA22736.1 amidohydrolase [Subtercola boreus]RFA23091.1 amidohydrolase [Subtercola boreus]RFA28844.1 amidohydrolase [Subtercola boreus]
MRIIAIEEHMLPRDVIEAAGVDLGLRAGKRAAELDEVGEARLRVMDDAGIDVQVLSALSYFVQGLEPQRAVDVNRRINDRLAEIVANRPDRFQAFAALPMSDPTGAADELTRCVEELGFLGAMIHGQTNGMFLDDVAARPVLEAATRLDVPLYLHPAPPPARIVDTYYSGLPPEVAACLSTSGWGWHSETAMHVLRMVAQGVFEHLPELKVILGHMGEGLPFHIDRIEDMLNPVVTGHSLSVAETLRRNLHLTTSGYNSEIPLQCAIAAFGVDRIIFSVDHPFAPSGKATDFLLSARLKPGDLEKIAHGNAEALLRIEGRS